MTLFALLQHVVASQGQSSCVGHCGSWAEKCYCDSTCEGDSDCCSDYEQVCGGPSPPSPTPPGPSPGDSCFGHCGSWAENCWCNTECESHQNCCGDYEKVCSGPGPAPAPTNDLTKTLLDLKKYPHARCLDGTAGGYYVRTGAAADHIVVYFEGGGWCYDASCTPTAAGTLANCKQWATSGYGTSRTWQPTKSIGGQLSADATANPNFHNWTTIYVPNCDGTGLSSNVSTAKDGVHFGGAAILDAVLAELIATVKLADAAKIVLTGGSAGANAVLWHVEEIRAAIEAAAAKVKAGNGGSGASSPSVVALPDAGFFLDLPAIDGTDCWPNQMRSMASVTNSLPAMNHACLARFPAEQWKCMFPQYYADLINTPTFLIQSLYDSSELWDTLKLNCCPAIDVPGVHCGSYPRCDAKSLALFQKLRTQHIVEWAQLVNKTGNGAWAPSCIEHTMTEDKWTNVDWAVPAKSGRTMSAAVAAWLAGNGEVWEDAVAFPGNAPCSSADLDFARARKRHRDRRQRQHK